MEHPTAERAAAQAGRIAKVEQGRGHGALVVVVVMMLTRLPAAATLLHPILALHGLPGLLLEALLLGRAPAVPDRVEVVVGGRGVLLEDVQPQALTILAPDIHQQGVVGDAEDPTGLGRGHALVPDVLQGFG